MLSSLRISQIYALDQDQAVDFLVGTLGLEINTTKDLGFMRFLTVNVPGEPDHQILLEKPGPPAMDPGDRGGGPLAPDQGSERRPPLLHHRRRAREGVPGPSGQRCRIHPGADSTALRSIHVGLRDPFGNHIRVAQMAPPAS